MFTHPHRRPIVRHRPSRYGAAGLNAAARRRGFTLLELLAVVAIMAVLMSLLIGVSLQFVEGAREKATRATLLKVDAMLQRRRSAIVRSLETGQGSVVSSGSRGYTPLRLKQMMAAAMPNYVQSYIRDDTVDPPETGLVTEAFEMQQELTGTKTDWKLRMPVVTGAWSRETDGKVRDFKDPATSFDVDPINPDDPTASAESLYLFLTSGTTFGVIDTDGAQFSASELADTDGDGLTEIVDGWGRPLRFYRWPTRLLRPRTTGAEDAQDAGGKYPIPGPLETSGGSTVTLVDPATLDGARSMVGGRLPAGTAKFERDPDEPFVGDPFLPYPQSELQTDSDDPLGNVGTEYQRAARLGGQTLNTVGQNFEQAFHAPATWHAMLVVSAGPDGELGLYEPHDRTRFGHLAQPELTAAGDIAPAVLDNVTNLQERGQ